MILKAEEKGNLSCTRELQEDCKWIDLSGQTLQARREWDNTFKVLKEKNLPTSNTM